LLVGHSYGGAVITEAGDLPNVVGLGVRHRVRSGCRGEPGQISQELSPAAIENLTPDSDGYLWIKQDKFHESFCQDLSDEQALLMAVTQKRPLASTFGDNVSYPAWKKVPKWYQVSTNDRMIHPDNERGMAERMGPRKDHRARRQPCSLVSQAGAVGNRSTEPRAS